jgi:hypothetical protein
VRYVLSIPSFLGFYLEEMLDLSKVFSAVLEIIMSFLFLIYSLYFIYLFTYVEPSLHA